MDAEVLNGRVGHASRTAVEQRLADASRALGEALAEAVVEVRRAVQRAATPSATARAETCERLVGVARAAKLLGVSERHVRSLLDSGALPRVKVGERVLIDMADLDKFIADHKATDVAV